MMVNKIGTQELSFINPGELPERMPLGQYVFEKLKQAIIRGEIAPGDRLVENRIADALSISRTPVREAIHKLEREGLLKKLPKGGFLAVSLSKEDIRETFGIRSALESYAARLAAVNHQQEEIKPLEEKIEEFQSHLNSGALEELTRINTEFHNILYGLSKSPKLIKMINDLRDQIYRYRKIILRISDTGKTSNEDHREMLIAIKNRDEDRVEKLVREHISRGQAIVLKALENNPELF